MKRFKSLLFISFVLTIFLLLTMIVFTQALKIDNQNILTAVYTDKVIVSGVAYHWVGPENGIPKHYWLHIGDKIYTLHFGGGPWKTTPDFTDQLIYIAEVRLGYFTKEDQPKEAGFIHWHELVPIDPDSAYDEKIGAWFRHVAVESFEITFVPMGKTWKVSPGVDLEFLPTPPPE